MRIAYRGIRALLAVLLLAALIGCTKLTRLDPNAGPLEQRLQAGDKVEVLTRDGRHMAFEIVSVDDELISGSAQSVRIVDVAELRREDPKYVDPVRTAVVALAMIGVFVLLVAL
jgi:hypothetical protein